MRRLAAIAVVLAAFAGLSTLYAGVPGAGGMRVLFEADSVYHHIVVAEDDEARYLRFDRAFQSGMLLRNSYESPFLYPAYAHLGLIFRPQAKRVLVVGLGGGSIPKRFWRDYSDMAIDVAELDPMVVDVAKRFFEVREDPRLRIAVQDGRQFLLRSARKYDIIILDAYFAESIPFHLTTVEFYRLVKSRLEPGGVVISNVIGALEGPRSQLFRAMYKTHGQVFPGMYPFAVAFRPYLDTDVIRNIMLVATDERGLSRSQILARARQVASRTTFPRFLQYAGDYYDGTIATSDVPILTDDYAPVDTLIPVYNWTPVRRP
jgi:spermidine synthase